MAMPSLPSATHPGVQLFGHADEHMLAEFFRQQQEMACGHPVVMEISTDGGDADIGRRLAQELRLWQAEGQEVFLLGKTYVFSAGTTILSAVPPDHRSSPQTASC